MEKLKFKTHYTEFPVDGRTFRTFAKRHMSASLCAEVWRIKRLLCARVYLSKFRTTLVRMSEV
jgi:hypothetical protein